MIIVYCHITAGKHLNLFVVTVIFRILLTTPITFHPIYEAFVTQHLTYVSWEHKQNLGHTVSSIVTQEDPKVTVLTFSLTISHLHVGFNMAQINAIGMQSNVTPPSVNW